MSATWPIWSDDFGRISSYSYYYSQSVVNANYLEPDLDFSIQLRFDYEQGKRPSVSLRPIAPRIKGVGGYRPRRNQTLECKVLEVLAACRGRVEGDDYRYVSEVLADECECSRTTLRKIVGDMDRRRLLVIEWDNTVWSVVRLPCVAPTLDYWGHAILGRMEVLPR